MRFFHILPLVLWLPEIELPPPLKGLEGFDFPEGMGEETDKGQAQRLAGIPSSGTKYKKAPVEQLIPEWPRAAEAKLPELPAMPEQPEKKPWENTTEFPELMMPEPEHKPGLGGSLVSHKNGFFLKAEDFRMVKDDIDTIIRVQKKHHKLTDIKKEESVEYDKMNVVVEDIQRKLMQVDKTLFEEQ